MSGKQSHVWEADIHVDAELARGRIEAQFPEIGVRTVEPFGMGWDNAAYLVDDTWLFRFPRREIAVPLLRAEIALLPHIAPRVPLPVPRPEFVGRPDEVYAWPFAGYVLLEGRTACSVPLSDAERAAVAGPLGAFFAALHELDLPADPDLVTSADVFPKTDLRRNAKAAIGSLDAVADLLPADDLARARERLAGLSGTSAWEGANRWVHGDVYARHLLVDEERRLAGVLDWGDVHFGDPALDLSIGFSFLPPAARGAFFDAYGFVDSATWDRARFRALFYAARLLEYGRSASDEALLSTARAALSFAL